MSDDNIADTVAMLQARAEAEAAHEAASRSNSETQEEFHKQHVIRAKEEEKIAAAHEKASERRIRDLKTELELMKAKGAEKGIEDTIKKIQEETEALDKLSDASGRANRAREKATEAQEAHSAVMKEFTSILKSGDGLMSQVKNLSKGYQHLREQGVSSAQATQMMTTKLKSMASAKNIAAFAAKAASKAIMLFATKLFTVALALESYTTNLVKATGMSLKLANSAVDTSVGLLEIGVSAEHTASAYAGLYSNYTDFTSQTASTQKVMATTTAMLENMGINSAETAANMQFMSKSLGMTGEQAAESSAEFATLARQIGMPIQEMSSQFQANAPILAKFGRQAPEVFKKLATAARAAGMDVSSVLAITEKFDTFEGAAQSVGQLNAILGGPFLNSMDMVMETDPTERMKMLSSALNETGQSFDDMDYYTKKSIASAAGLKDVNELALVMGGRWDLVGEGINQSADDIAKLAEQQADYNTVMGQLKSAVQAAFIPLAKEFLPVLQSVSKGLIKWGPTIAKVIKGLFMFALVVTTIIGVVFAAKAVMAAWVAYTAGSGFVAIIFAIGNALGAIGPAIAGLVASFYALIGVQKDVAHVIEHDAGSPGLLEIIEKIGKAFMLMNLPLLTTIKLFGLISEAAKRVAGPVWGTVKKVAGFFGFSGPESETSDSSGLKSSQKVKTKDQTGSGDSASRTISTVTEKAKTEKANAEKASGKGQASAPPVTKIKQPVKVSIDIGGKTLKEFVFDIVDEALDGENTTVVPRKMGAA